MWVRYKHRFAYGEDKKWSHIEIPDEWETWGYSKEDYIKDGKEKYYSYEYALTEFLEDEMRLGKSHEWSDKYRGFKWETIDNPPVELVLKEIKSHRSSIDHHKKELKRFQKMLDELGHVTKEDFNV